MAVTREAGATIFIPSENEWYKAAYYDPTLNSGVGGYYQYPFSSDAEPTSAPAGSTPNTGNFQGRGGTYAVTGSWFYDSSQNYLTDVGAYTASASPYGVFDMGGEVWQWDEAVIFGSGRGVRGGAWGTALSDFGSTSRSGFTPSVELNFGFGFRVASVTEPSTAVLAALGVASLIACGWRRRKR